MSSAPSGDSMLLKSMVVDGLSLSVVYGRPSGFAFLPRSAPQSLPLKVRHPESCSFWPHVCSLQASLLRGDQFAGLLLEKREFGTYLRCFRGFSKIFRDPQKFSSPDTSETSFAGYSSQLAW